MNKNLQLSDQELQIIKKGLSDLIDKQGLTEPQEIYLHSIDSGISTKEAYRQFKIDNSSYWEFMIKQKKDPIYILFDKIFNF